MKMIESRCGIICSECGFKSRIGCAGCINIEHPFWGEICPVKSCVETKELNHCGECEDFPCKLAKSYAYVGIKSNEIRSNCLSSQKSRSF